MQSMLDDEGDEEKKETPLTILASHKTKLEALEKVCADKAEEFYALKTRQNNNADYIGLLEAEKSKLERAQQQDLNVLDAQAASMLSETVRTALIVDAGRDIAEIVANTATHLMQMVEAYKALQKTHADLEMLRKDLLDKKSKEFPAQLKILAAMRTQVFNLLRANEETLQESWQKCMTKFDLVADQDKLKQHIFSFSKTLQPVELGLVEATDDAVKTLSAEILEVLKSILTDENNFFIGYYDHLLAPLMQDLLLQEPVLWDFYRHQMKKLDFHYSWLIAAHSYELSYGKLAEVADVISQDAVKQLDQWLTKCVQPFLMAYKLVQERKKQIDALDAILTKLRNEQALIVRWLSKQDEWKRQLDSIGSQLKLVKSLQPVVAKRVKHIEEVMQNKAIFDKSIKALSDATTSLYVNVSGEVFLRLKHLFLSNIETKEILAALTLRANKHHKKENKAAILAFIPTLAACYTSLYELLQLIQHPLDTNTLGSGQASITLKRTKGGPTETCKLIRRLNNVLMELINNYASKLRLEDLNEEFSTRRLSLRNFSFLDDVTVTSTNAQQGTSRFDYYCTRFLDALGSVETKRSAIVQKIQADLQALKEADKDELTKIKDIREIIERERQILSQTRGGEPSLNLFKGSRLGVKLKEQLEQLDLLLASIPVLTRSLSIADRK
jgi:hypothetical protein